ncbi:MAG TPA: discoidin domain-containing protein [Prolixibacteraceae bacterium]|nr:discoidin domain-containing protein [Prolixibacteraceae bacterium]
MGRLLHARLIILSLLLLAWPNLVSAQVSVSSMFSSGMVLQQNTDVNIWGWANAGDTVSVTGSWDNRTVKTVTQVNKKWMLKLRTPVAKADGSSFTVTVKGTNILVLKDVLIGEVWLLSGQSNMEMPMEGWTGAPVEGSAQAIAAATYPNIRLLIAGKKSSSVPMANITKNYTNSTWTACSPASVRSFSAAGYFFGKELHTELNIPIGLVQSAWGGSSCETWANPSSLEFVTDYKNKGPWAPTKADDNHTPTVLYNGMIAPIVPFTFAGVLWYQGETNVGRPQQLTELFPAMIEGWRQDFQNSTLPFYYVQLCAWSGNGGTSLPETWEAQSYAQLLMNTGMTGTLDISDINNIHPAKKEPVGHRLALWALAKTYGKEALVHSGPQYRSMQAEGNKLRLSFDHAGSGLKAENNAPLQFEIAGSNLIFYPANTLIDGQTLLVWNDNIAAPKQVRYAWSGTATATLYNHEGLPATPFRTNTPAHMQPVKAMMLTGSELLKEGEQATLSWTTIGAKEVTLNGETVAASGSLQLKPAANTTYTLVAKGDQSIITKSITVNVIPNALYNWSINRTATALSTNTGSSASLAFDANPATAWKSISSNNQWITVDLGEPVPLSNVILHWGEAYAKAYQIQVSDDNKTWTTVYTETAGDGRIDNIQNIGLSARYVRMLGTLTATTQGFTLNEMTVYSLQKPIMGALKDKNGNTMRGTPMVLGKALTESVAFALNTANWETIRNNGYNTIRVCWVDPWYKSHAKDCWTVAEVLPYLDQCVQNATATGMNIIINCHDVGAQQESDKTYQFALEKEFWNAVAPRYKDNDLVYYEPANEPTFTLSDYLKVDFKESYLQLYNTIRTLAPKRQVLFFSFNTIASDIVNVVENYKDQIAWEHTTVAYHMYNSSSSAAVKTLMAYHPVICTEWFYDHVSRLPGNEFIRQVDGFKQNAQTLEKIGSGWMDWRDWGDVTLDELTDTLIVDAKAKNYWWGQPVSGLKATGIILSQHKVELVSGNTTKLIAFPLPALAEDQKIIWSSSDPGIASVDANWLITAVASRDASAVITAKTSDGGFTATCEVKVLASAAKIAYPDGNPHQIPGIIQVTHYDRGGEGVGFHDLTTANDGEGIRINEGVDTGVLVAGGNIGGISTGEWLEYTVEVLQEGNYTFEMLFATVGRYGKFHIEMNGVDKTGRLSVIPSGSYSKFVTTQVPGIKLEKGVQVMRIFFDYAEYNLGPVTVTRDIPSSNKELTAHKKIKIYPCPTDGKLFVSGIEKGNNYSIINVYGQVLQSGIISENHTFDVIFLDAGSYFIRFENNKGYRTERFVKL